MKNFFLLFSLLLFGCQDYNSNTSDKVKYGIIELEASPRFRAAYPIIQSRCVNCHFGTHNIWASYITNQLWIDSGDNRVIPGNAADSNFIRRTINSGNNNSNMPLGGSALSADEYQILVDWINGIGQPE